MYWRKHSRQLCVVVIGSYLVGGCSYADLFDNPKGVTSPQPAQIAQYIAQTEIESVDAGIGRRMQAGEYLIGAMAYTNERCHAFFDVLERFKDDNSLFGKVLDAAAAAGTPLLGFTSGSSEALRFASALAIGKQVNTSLGEIYTYVAHRDQLKRHVLGAMSDFRQVNGLSALTRGLIGMNDFQGIQTASLRYNPIYSELQDDTHCRTAVYEIDIPNGTKNGMARTQVNECRLNAFLRSDKPIHLLIARNIATEYASLCSLSHLKSIIGDALSKTETQVNKPDTSATNAVPVSEAAATEASKKAEIAAANAQKAVAGANSAAARAIDAADNAASSARDSRESAESQNTAKPADH